MAKAKTVFPAGFNELLLEKFHYDSSTGIIRRRKGDAFKIIGLSVNSVGYMKVQVTFNGKIHHLLQHRLAWFLHYGSWPTEIDHINMIKTDQRIVNLREVTRSQNMSHRVKAITKNSTSLYVGVTLSRSHPKNKPWQSRIYKELHGYFLGYFTTEEEAAKAYDAKSFELFGEFAILNFPDDYKAVILKKEEDE